MTMSTRFAAAALTVSMIAGALPSQAQLFPGPPPLYPAPPPYGAPPPPPIYGQRPYAPPRPYYQPRREVGYTCSTSRGACDIDGAYVGSGCRCYIPGFGSKGGSVTP